MEATGTATQITTCTNERHDHFEDPICDDCGKASHYDWNIADWQHDAADAADCSLTVRRTNGSACN